MPPDTPGVYRAASPHSGAGRLGALRQIVGTGSRQGYWGSFADLWGGVAPALDRLDELAAEPEELLDEDAPEILASLQYVLHAAGERAAGLRAPVGLAELHEELAAALAAARDATADVGAAAELGGAEAARPYVYEWRGALFRVRLARLRLVTPAQAVPEEPEAGPARPYRAAIAVLLVLAGTVALLAGALEGASAVAAAGVAAFAAGAFAYRP